MASSKQDISLYSKIFNVLPAPAIVFFRKRGAKPMANDAARQLFGTQLMPLVRSQFFREQSDVTRKYPASELPWILALAKGVGAVRDDLFLQRKESEAPKRLKAFAMPIFEGKNIIAVVATFQEI
ncbi:MAG: hypothetical protein Q8Q39_02330 [bacterium]|nr:hypothetical protein [bacterium]